MLGDPIAPSDRRSALFVERSLALPREVLGYLPVDLHVLIDKESFPPLGREV